MPRSTSAIALVALTILAAAAGVSAQHELHGSGTTNPSKFFWKLMDLMEERARQPITMTYRGVGTLRIPSRTPSPIPKTRRVTFWQNPDKTLNPRLYLNLRLTFHPFIIL
jgi:hypothetical protein|tara:strand:+ start:691 stop:1020 length:330 start_codon:yes stop_codon:yes gene_type:complete